MGDRSLLSGVPREHAGDFLGPDPAFHPRKASRRPAAGDVLLDPIMIIGANRDGSEMCNAEHLLGLPELLEVLADGHGHLTANPGVDLVEDETVDRVAPGEHGLGEHADPAAEIRAVAAEDVKRLLALEPREVREKLAGRVTMNGNVHTVETLIRGGV